MSDVELQGDPRPAPADVERAMRRFNELTAPARCGGCGRHDPHCECYGDDDYLEPSRAQVDPASFKVQLDGANEAIRELLALYDKQTADVIRLEQIIAEALHCWERHSAREAVRTIRDAGVSAASSCRRCGVES